MLEPWTQLFKQDARHKAVILVSNPHVRPLKKSSDCGCSIQLEHKQFIRSIQALTFRNCGCLKVKGKNEQRKKIRQNRSQDKWSSDRVSPGCTEPLMLGGHSYPQAPGNRLRVLVGLSSVRKEPQVMHLAAKCLHFAFCSISHRVKQPWLTYMHVCMHEGAHKTKLKTKTTNSKRAAGESFLIIHSDILNYTGGMDILI